VLNPIPVNELKEVDAFGFGLVLMHRSIISKLRDVCGNQSPFAESLPWDDVFISEDISFCINLKKAGIQAFAHTGAVVEHVKRFSLDINYYNTFWLAKEANFFEKINLDQNEKL